MFLTQKHHQKQGVKRAKTRQKPDKVKERKEKEIKGKESKVNIIDDSFEEWWFSYDKKTGKEKAYNKWKILLPQEKDLALSVVHKYVKSTPDKQWRKDPTTYLHSKSFNDEIIERTISTKLSYAELEWERLKNLG